MTFSPESASIGHQAQTVTFTVTSSVGWILQSDAEWITPEVVSGAAGKTQVRLTVAENQTEGKRTGGIVFSSTDLPTNYTFSVTQTYDGDPDAGNLITIVSDPQGTASADSERAFPGVAVTILAEPVTGYSFTEWEVEAGEITVADPFAPQTTFIMGSKDVKLRATYHQSSESQETDFTDQLTGVNKIIYEYMRVVYYWDTAVQTLEALPANSNNLDADPFLKALIGNLDWYEVQDTSNGENPPTIDGQWNATRTEREHIYSFAEVDDGTRVGLNETTLGLGFIPLDAGLSTNVQSGNDIRYFFISWILPGGPAEAAGLKRGTVISKYNGSDIFWSQYDNFWKLAYGGQSGTATLTDMSGTQYTIASQRMDVSPIVANEIVQSPGGKKVAYFAYTEFASGSYRRQEFDEEMREAFGMFKAAGAEELVIDLRYNGGGEVNSCQVLSSLAGNVSSSEIFCQMLRNETYAAELRAENPEIMNFLDEENSLGMDRVYVLATKSSASASEMVISALKGVDVEVIIIGGETNGKNVGMDGIGLRDNGINYGVMWPITFKIMNAKGFCNYAGGFPADYAIDELRDLNTTDGTGIKELGDPEEDLLQAALTLIDGGQPEVDPATRGMYRKNYHFEGELRNPRRESLRYTRPDDIYYR